MKDIEYCMNQNCGLLICKRNPKRLKSLNGHVFKFFEGTNQCMKEVK